MGLLDNIKDQYHKARKRFRESSSNGISTVINALSKKSWNNSSESVLDEHGDAFITKILIVRAPLSGIFRKVGNFSTGGDLEKEREKLNYDDLYHLSLAFQLTDGAIVRVEKLNTVYLKEGMPPGETYIIQPSAPVTLEQFLEKGRRSISPEDFWLYNIRTRNCQLFVLNMLAANGYNETGIRTFVYQDANQLLSKQPDFARNSADTLLDVATLLDPIIPSKWIGN